MKITRVELIPLTLKLKTPYTVAYQTFDHADHLFLRLESGGRSGWGCMAPDPFVTGEDVQKIHPELRDALPALLVGGDPFRRAQHLDRIKKAFPLYPGVRAMADMALWDLLGNYAGLPVWKIIGGYRSRIETSITIGICPLQETLEQAREFVGRGFAILKIKGGVSPEEDGERVIRVYEEFGKGVRLRFDANQGYDIKKTMTFLDIIKDIPLELLEQPTGKEDTDSLGHITNRTEVNIMADESLLSLMDAFTLARKGLVDMMNIKLLKVGGITDAIQVDSVARSAKIKVMVGCMDESALGISAGLHFALSRKNILYADLDGHFDLIDDPAAGTVITRKGFLYPSEKPGLGFGGL
ncbi:MAG: dipeptide epimerase [Spirochaetales bacterium]|nr:dipeptide epimerase [Spirochaetales bacterium]